MALNCEVHPAAEIFPMMDADSLSELQSDIEKNGLQEPIVWYCGKLLDGRNRLTACQNLGIIPDELDLTKDIDPVAYVVSANLKRRHLTTSQQSMVAAKVEHLYAVGAKERQRDGGRNHGKGQPKVVENSSQPIPKSRDAAGAAVGVSGFSVGCAKTVIEKGSKELQNAVETGKVSVSKAASIAKQLPKKEQLEAALSKPVPVKKPHPLSDQYMDLVGRFSVALVQIEQDFGGVRSLVSNAGWDKAETKVFKQQITALLRVITKIEKELKSV